MTETMKKTNEAIARFKPPFRVEPPADLDPNGYSVVDAENKYMAEGGIERIEIICEALNFYYANKREQSERKGEKE